MCCESVFWGDRDKTSVSQGEKGSRPSYLHRDRVCMRFSSGDIWRSWSGRRVSTCRLDFKCEDAEETVSTTCSTSAAALPNTWEQADCHWMCHFPNKRTCLNIHVAAAMWQQVKHIQLKREEKKNQRGKRVCWRRDRRRGRSWWGLGSRGLRANSS